MTEFDIERVLNFRMEEFRGVFPIDVVYANTDYTPTVGTDFIKVDFLPATSNSASIGVLSKNRIEGLYQLHIHTESMKGQARMKQVADALQAYFRRGTGISFMGVNVRILRYRMWRATESASWYTQVWRVEFRADIDN